MSYRDKRKKKYKGMIENNGYIQLDIIVRFLQSAMIADIELIAKVYGKGMSEEDYRALQEALEEIGTGDC